MLSRRTQLLAGLALGALGGVMIARRLSAPAAMPYLHAWQRGFAARRGAAEAASLAAPAQARYDELMASAPYYPQRALRYHLKRAILPGLALYQTLREHGYDGEAALAEVQSVVGGAALPLRRLVPLLGWLPNSFAAFRVINRWVLRLGFPAQGWEMVPVEDSDRCLAFDMRRCFYLDTLTAQGAPELTPVYCQGDDILFEALPPSITWERTMTMGRGGDRCDFRWCRRDDGEP
ncbi:MAG: L-2-amino-thiazoline-4-carboxylic acid hydrolase [Chloroflexi bacterium]|nr:L-2-amino-thiazoline-4-carboxylic acid hydrolase [Chloroflexota bacterium]